MTLPSPAGPPGDFAPVSLDPLPDWAFAGPSSLSIPAVDRPDEGWRYANGFVVCRRCRPEKPGGAVAVVRRNGPDGPEWVEDERSKPETATTTATPDEDADDFDLDAPLSEGF